MAIYTITIDDISGGEAPVPNFAQKNQFWSSANLNLEDGDLRQTTIETLGTAPSDIAMWNIKNAKDSNTYEYLYDGKINAVSNDYSTVTALNSGAALTASTGNGAAYYDNYIYFAKNTDIARYGPLNGTPSLSQTYWTGTLGKTALANTTYPTIDGYKLPNHVMYAHTDNKLYFADVVNGQGVIHYIETSKTTVEGDTNAGSTYNALDLPYGFYPTAIAGYGTDLVVACVDISQNMPAKLIFWDTTSSTYTQIISVELTDPLITAIRNVNGKLVVFSGQADQTQSYYRIQYLAGGYTLRNLTSHEIITGYPPMQGEVAHFGEKIYYSTSGYIYSIGGELGFVTKQAIYALYSGFMTQTIDASRIGAISIYGYARYSVPLFTAKETTGVSNVYKRAILSTSGGTANGGYFRSQTYKIGRPFQINSVILHCDSGLSEAVTPEIRIDNSGSSTLTVLSPANYQNNETIFVLKPDGALNGKNNFYLELTWAQTGSTTTLELPIIIEIETLEDGTY